MHRINWLFAGIVGLGLPTVIHAQQVLVVLDCSQSMAREVTLPAAPNSTRLEIACDALERALQGLVGKNRRVGVMLYGHRVGWRPGTMTVLQQKGWGRKIPQELFPYEDVELIQSPGLYGAAEHRGLVNLLQTVQPWGETPQYLALQTAIGQLNKGDRILLLTDGTNSVYRPPANKNPQAANVLNAAKKAGVKIDAVVVAMDQNTPWQQQADLVKQTGGTWTAVAPVALDKAIAKSLK